MQGCNNLAKHRKYCKRANAAAGTSIPTSVCADCGTIVQSRCLAKHRKQFCKEFKSSNVGDTLLADATSEDTDKVNNNNENNSINADDANRDMGGW